MSRNYQSEQLEQLQRMLENPKQQSGLYLIDTDLSDEEIETCIKKDYLCRYVKEMLIPPSGKALALFIVGLSHQCKDDSIEFTRNQFFALYEQKSDVALYNLLIQVFKVLFSSGKYVVHIQGELDLLSLCMEDLYKLDAALKHHAATILMICKKKSKAMPKGNTIIKIKSLKETVRYRLMENRVDKVHISYKHDDAYEDALKAIEMGLEKNHIPYSIDKYDILYKGNIDDYEKEIGISDRIIMFVIPKYFESLDCMFEMTQMFKNGDVKERIFPVVDMEGLSRKGEGLIKVKDYWQEEKLKRLKCMQEEPGGSSYLLMELQKINDVIKTLDDFWEFICRYSTGDFRELIANDASLLMEKIKETFPRVSAHLEKKIESSEETKPTALREVVQNGKTSLYIENNMGSITIN